MFPGHPSKRKEEELRGNCHLHVKGVKPHNEKLQTAKQKRRGLFGPISTGSPRWEE